MSSFVVDDEEKEKGIGIGVLKNTASCTGFNIFNVSAYNFGSGTIRTYGLRVDS